MKRFVKNVLICGVTLLGGAMVFLPAINTAQSTVTVTAPGPTAAAPAAAAPTAAAPTIAALAALTAAAPTDAVLIAAAPVAVAPGAATLAPAALTAAHHSDDLPAERPPLPVVRLEGSASGEDAIRQLGDKLDAVAAHYGKSAEQLRAELRRDHSLMVDVSGRLHFREKDMLSSGSTLAVAGATYPLDQTFFLHSRAGSKRKVYLNFKGMAMAGTVWNSGTPNIFAPPYDTDGVPGTFGSGELTAIQNIWRTVSEDYAPFDVDITTEPPTEDQMNRSTFADDTFGVTVLFTNRAAFPAGFCGGCAGTAYYGDFDDVSTNFFWKVALVFQNNDFWRARTASHEIGHLLGLSHDGSSTTKYYAGQGAGATGWGPIMGHSNNALVQFSKGEYADANNKEDDYLVMQQHGVTFAADDFGNTIATAAALIPTFANGVDNFAVKGVIETPTDVDMFKFTANAGTVTINADPFEVAPNLDILLKLLDSNGNTLAQSNPTGALNAALTYALPANGTYYISIEGTGEGDPMVSGYSKYGSIGRYAVTLTAPHPMAVVVPPVTAVKWVLCASENGTCNFTGTRQVRYGANGVYVTQTATNSIGCNNGVWGDPVGGVVKACSYADDGSTPVAVVVPPVTAVNWVFCASENGTCNFTGTRQVRYGANGIYATQTATNSIGCNNGVWGDPAGGVVKACSYADNGSTPVAVVVPPVTAVNWVLCASEGGTCNFTGTRQVRYGAKGIYSTQTATNSIGCSNGVWGDPLFGVVKACEYLN